VASALILVASSRIYMALYESADYRKSKFSLNIVFVLRIILNHQAGPGGNSLGVCTSCRIIDRAIGQIMFRFLSRSRLRVYCAVFRNEPVPSQIIETAVQKHTDKHLFWKVPLLPDLQTR
jgi:hypothetical protein